MDTHSTGTEMGLETEGAALSTKDIEALTASEEINYPMPGEIPSTDQEAGHSHGMPEEGLDVIQEVKN
jgi:hypothetical protein